MANMHITRVKREFKEIVSSEEACRHNIRCVPCVCV